MENGETAGDASRPWQSYHTVYTNAKAGMDGVDKEKVQRIVYEMSKGSKYFENEERKESYMRQKIENMRVQCTKLSTADISHHQKVADRRIAELEATRDLSRIWLHVDMDAFYAAVETLSNPALKGKPMAVGSMSMISTANYEARRYGVRAAMPGFIARKLCPELIFVPVDFLKYTRYSTLTREVFQVYDPNFIATSLDEAYLDITEVCKGRSLASEEIAEELRRGVYEKTGLTCSAGVAPNRLLAKICSDINKPNGQFVLPNDQMAVMTFISSLPIRKIGGIGKVTEHILRDAFGISTCKDMLEKSGLLCALFSRSSADFFLSVGLGLGKTDAPQLQTRKSMSNERTFSATDNQTFLYEKLAELAEMLYADLKKEGLCGKTLTLKLKTAAFEVRTRAMTLQNYILSSEDIFKHASKLLKAELPISIRLIGLRVSHFREEKFGPSDPAQKSITNFILQGDASGNNVVDHSCLESNAVDDFMMDAANYLTCTHNTSDYGCKYPLDIPQLLDSGYDNVVHVEKNNGLLDGEYEEMNSPDSIGRISESHETDIRHFAEMNSPPSCNKSGDNVTTVSNLEVDDAVTSSIQQEEILWVDDYKCSVCGIELPPWFVDERQEHSDFHLAERLQETAESRSSSTIHMMKQRLIPRGKLQNQSRRKKQKPSLDQGKYLPIDIFFTKSNQN
ncbi:hypothetical protein Nepgr_004933 [Nepenthes gracilis]|uniref:DNA polymerase kappa n=1 Tax=Nepenthes gracilis TaxID=150966 RepID=A0AAD3S2C7_NEPGR|nr:hypothetical protein Nepgr_004933 [Nepenthes gracilis]